VSEENVSPPPGVGEGVENAPGPALPVPVLPSAPTAAPYRTVAQEASAMVTPPRAWPIVGSSLWVSGVSMWAFLVMGELTTSYGPGKRDLLIGEGLANAFFFGAAVAAWVYALRQMMVTPPARRLASTAARAVAVAALAFVMWLVVAIAAIIVGESSRKNLDGKITVTLMLLAAAAAFGGLRMTGFRRGESTPGARKAWLAIWFGAAVFTLVALIEVIATD
jgi:hypothetical protein